MELDLRVTIRQRRMGSLIPNHLLPRRADVRPGVAAVTHVDEHLVVLGAEVVAGGEGEGLVWSLAWRLRRMLVSRVKVGRCG